jgi:hypothetical protein
MQWPGRTVTRAPGPSETDQGGEEVSSASTRVRPWFLRVVDRTSLSAVQTAGILATALLACNFALWRMAPEVASGSFGDLLLIFPVALFYMLVMGSWCERQALRDLASLRPHITCSDPEYAELEHSMTHHSRRLIAGGSLAGIAIAVLLGIFGGRDTIEAVRPALLLPVALESLLLWVVTVPTCLMIFVDASSFGRIGREHLRVDLFDRRPLETFVRVGLRVALVLLGLVGLRAAFYAFSAPTPLVLANLGPMIAVVALATASLLLPLWGVRARILDAKQLELDRVHREIDLRRVGGVAPIDADEGVPRSLINLLDYLARVEAVGEWPFDAPELARFVAYLLIPVLGWIGGAVMEQLVGSLMH